MTPTDKTGLFLIALIFLALVAWVVIKIVYTVKDLNPPGAKEDSEEI